MIDLDAIEQAAQAAERGEWYDRYIAAANPATILALIARLREVEHKRYLARARLTGILECFEHGDKWTPSARRNVIESLSTALKETGDTPPA